MRNDEESLQAIIQLISNHSQLDFSRYKRTTILSTTKRRAALNNFSTLCDFFGFLKTSQDELDALSRDFLISVTSFFRDPDAFDFIQKNIFPALLEKLKPGEELKMWVAGCATGEEVYSFCIMIAELLKEGVENTVVKIFATDVDNEALGKARKGIYRRNIEKNISAERLKNYFTKEGNNYKVKPIIRKMAVFANHNLVTNPPYCNMHFISCRNVLFYLVPELQKKAFAMLKFGLKLNGYLFLGDNETPADFAKDMQLINENFNLHKNHHAKQQINFDIFILPELTDIKPKTAHSNTMDISKNAGNTIFEAIGEGITNELGMLAVLIDENDFVQKFYGDTTKFLLQRHFTNSLSELLPVPLKMAFIKIKKSVIDTGQKAAVTGIKIKSSKVDIVVNLVIRPILVGKTAQKLLMVIISEDKTNNNLYPREIAFRICNTQNFG